ncbi:hypothetical protein A9Q86_01240 [Flavobacteriales bacterium 33_180_T64]|nr:hypothetical protein A9Q86_01240 [Flavobacteriales bacterium 33_180_T64]
MKTIIIMKTQFKFPQKNLAIITLVMVALLAYNPLYAQTEKTISTTQSTKEITVKGSVSDENGPLLGASVSLKGSDVGIIVVNENGAFTFPRALKLGDILVFSFLGYETKEIKIQENTAFLKVMMTSDVVEILGALESNKPYKSKRPKN